MREEWRCAWGALGYLGLSALRFIVDQFDGLDHPRVDAAAQALVGGDGHESLGLNRRILLLRFDNAKSLGTMNAEVLKALELQALE